MRDAGHGGFGEDRARLLALEIARPLAFVDGAPNRKDGKPRASLPRVRWRASGGFEEQIGKLERFALELGVGADDGFQAAVRAVRPQRGERVERKGGDAEEREASHNAGGPSPPRALKTK